MWEHVLFDDFDLMLLSCLFFMRKLVLKNNDTIILTLVNLDPEFMKYINANPSKLSSLSLGFGDL